MKWGLPWLVVRWARGAGGGTIDFSPALATLDSPVQNIIFLTAHFFSQVNIFPRFSSTYFFCSASR